MFDGYLTSILSGTWITIQLMIYALAVGISLGLVFALIKLSSYRLPRLLVQTITTALRGLPELLVLFTIYFGAEILLHAIAGYYIEVNYFISGVIALGLIFAAYFSETLYGAYHVISTGSIEAAQAFGFSTPQRIRHILLPQLWRYALPGFSNQCLVLLKDTSIVSLIGLSDLMAESHIASSSTGKPFTFYLLAGGIYLCLTTISMLLLKRLQQKVAFT